MLEQWQEFQNLSSELKKITKTLSLLARNINEKSKPGFWTRKINIITKAYFIVYVAASTLFLAYIFSAWTSPDE